MLVEAMRRVRLAVRTRGNDANPGGAAMRFRILVAIVAVLLFSAAAVQPAARASVPAGFVTRSGTQLTLNGQPFLFTGVNIYNANSDGWCGFPYTNQQFDQTLSDLGPGKEVIRAWFFQSLATENGQRDWSRFDRTIAAAGAQGMKVIVTLTDQWGECGDAASGMTAGYKDATWYQTGYRTITQPDALAPYRDWVAEVVNRYKDNPTVAFWQLINEAEVNEVVGGQQQPCPPGNGPADTLRSWAQDVGGLVKSIDSNHLVSLGTIGNGQCGAQSDQYQYVHDIPEIDLCEYHDYGSPTVGIPGDQWNGLQRRIDQCDAIGKPLFVGEAGIKPTELDGTYTARANAFRAKINAQVAAGVQGFAAWNWSAHGSTPDNYDIGPGDPALDALTGSSSTERLSVAWNGAEANSVSQLDALSNVSADGRYVVFASYATNLAPGGTNGNSHIYVRDRLDGTTQLVSTRWNGGPANNSSAEPTISSDGRYVAFTSGATDLLDPSGGVVDSNNTGDVYVRDLQQGTTRLASIASDGTLANGISEHPALSADGRYLAFDSRASTLLPAGQDTNGTSDVYLRDLTGSGITRVSVRSDGTQGNGPSSFPSISADGHTIAFASSASNFLSGAPAGALVRDMTVASGWTLEQVPGLDGQPDLDSNGRFVAFPSDSSLVPEDSNRITDVYRYDRQSQAVALVSVGNAGQATGAPIGLPSIDGDGNSVVFISSSPDLLAPGADTNGVSDAFMWRDGTITRISLGNDGAEANDGTIEVGVSADGAVVVFSSYASNLIAPAVDGNGTLDVFARTTGTGAAGATVPDPPMDVTATAGDGSATVRWTPGSDGGRSITKFTVTSLPGGQTAEVGGSATSAVVTGLTNGTSYTFTVVATNSVGDSQPSPPSNTVSPNAPPSDPVSLGQFEANGATAIPIGGTTDGTTVVSKGTVSDPDGGQVRLEIELKPVGTAFDGTGLLQSPGVASGATAQVAVAGLSRDRRFHWRARSVDSANATSGWVSFGANAESSTDVRVEGRIVFSSNRQGANNANAQEIYVMDPNGSNAVRLTTNTTIDTDPALSPDGTRIAFQSTRDGDYEIFVMNVDGSGVVQLTTNTAIDQSPAWSPDGNRIAFVSNRLSNGNVDVFVMNADGTNVTRLTTSAGADGYPSWSPDGTKIAFSSPRDGDSEIFTMNANGNAQTQLTFNKRDDSFPAWSSDGTRIVFSSNRDASNSPDIYVMNADGTSPVRLTTKAGQDTAPAWSRDGSRILFQGIDTDSDWEIYRILANGTGLTKLTNNARADVTPSW
jgi:mannan endo-1,4-beta-mannosidase